MKLAACAPPLAIGIPPTDIPVPSAVAASPSPTPSPVPEPTQGSQISLELSDLPIFPSTAADVELLHALGDHSPSVAGLAFLPDGLGLASVSKDLALKVWDVASGQGIDSPIEDGERTYNVVFSPDGALLATGGSGNTIKLWDVKTGERIRTLRPVWSVAWSPDGKLLATGDGVYLDSSSRGSIVIWERP